jgi:LytS/YehU family sensor histidine kinase
VASTLWVLGNWALQPLLGHEPWLPAVVPQRRVLAFGFARGTALCSAWSALFLVNLLSTRVQRERERGVRAAGLAHQARLLFLQSQLNPHFLFNALNSVVALIDENPAGARRMVRDLAALLRRTLAADDKGQTTVEEELDFVRMYVACEEVRFESRLQITYQVEGEVLGQPVPSMLLHPLVENAIKYGMQTATSRPLEIRVSVRRERASLLFEVANTGTLARPANALLPAGPGIGLRNVQERLRALFPERHRFELTESDGWVTARIQLPLSAA